MTMVPAQSVSKLEQQDYDIIYGGYGGGYNRESYGVMKRLEYCISEGNCILGSDLVVMAEDESRSNSLNTSKDKENNDNNQEEEEEEEEEERDEGWLRLSIGGNTTSNTIHKYDDEEIDGRRGGLIELDLLRGGGSSSNQLSAPIFHVPSPPVMNMNMNIAATSFTTSLFFQQQQQQAAAAGSSSSIYPHQQINWAFRHMPPSSSPNSSSLMPLGSYFSRPFQLHTSVSAGAGPSSSDLRLIHPPRRPHSGIWFTLQASLNQAQEPFLPQISKSYLRIKDGRMTVRLLIKYLVNKLKLDSESEVEITCRGQQLLPFLTLQHVRDNIWSPRDAITLLPDSSTIDHIMVLHYGRSPQK